MKPIRVLIAEDDRSTRALLELHIRAADGLELCAAAQDGVEALSMLHQESPDLLLLDLVMPELDGVQVLEQLQANPPPKRPKVIVTSAVSSDAVVRSVMRLGADYYVVKPCDMPALFRRIVELCAPVSPPQDPALACLLGLGADERDLGFRFALAALPHLGGPGEYVLLKTVYFQVAAECDSSYDRVERNLRTMIGKLHALGTPRYRALFGSERPPANGTFLRALAREVGLILCSN